MRLRVAAGVLRDRQGRVLIAERLTDGPFCGLWEFPGGKLDPEETPEAALKRELCEELDIEITEFEPFITVRHDYADRLVQVDFFLVTGWRKEIRGVLGQAFRWVAIDGLRERELLPANAAVLEALRNSLDSP